MKVKQRLKTFMTIIITAMVTFSVTVLWIYGRKGVKDEASLLSQAFKSDKFATKINLIRQKIDSDYMGEINEEKLMEWAVKGYVAGLEDKYSEYFMPLEMEDYTSDTLGTYVGIGIYITLDTEKNAIMIYDTMENSPAEKAGLQKDDEIIGVDGTECNGDDYDTITEKIKGQIGSKVKITVKRTDENNEEQILDFEVERISVEVVRVTSKMLVDKIGYINITNFDGTKVSDQFEQQYDDLLAQGMEGLIIDVRENGGGIVDEAVEIADLFTDKDQVLLIEKDKKGNEKETKSKRDKKITMKTVLLTDGHSASASEILAGIIKDVVDNATIVGTKTYGKGIIQTLYMLSDGSGLKLTTEKYYTPNRNEINGKGIEPDVLVEGYTYTGTIDLEEDTQLKKAIELLK